MDEWKNNLYRNLSFLHQNLEVHKVLDALVEINPSLWATLRDTIQDNPYAYPNNRERVNEFLKHFLKRPVEDYDLFLRILTGTDQEHIRRKLTGESEAQLQPPSSEPNSTKSPQQSSKPEQQPLRQSYPQNPLPRNPPQQHPQKPHPPQLLPYQSQPKLLLPHQPQPRQLLPHPQQPRQLVPQVQEPSQLPPQPQPRQFPSQSHPSELNQGPEGAMGSEIPDDWEDTVINNKAWLRRKMKPKIALDYMVGRKDKNYYQDEGILVMIAELNNDKSLPTDHAKVEHFLPFLTGRSENFLADFLTALENTSQGHVRKRILGL